MFRKHSKRKQLNLNVNNEELNSRKFRKRKRKQTSEKLNSKELPTNDEGSSAHEANADSMSKVHFEEENVLEGDAFGEDLLQNDPYSLHLNNELSPSVFLAVSSKPPKLEKLNFSWSTLGTLQFVKPLPQNEDNSVTKERTNLLEKNSYAELRTLPEENPEFDWDKLHIKSQILENAKIKSRLVNPGKPGLQEELLTIASNYHDIYFPEENFENIDDVQFVYCVHAINHVIKARLKVLHHNSKLSKRSEVTEEFRDQGLVKPKVLILLPFRESANRVVKLLSYILLGEKENVMNKKRFIDEYTGNEIIMPEKNPKPPDYQLLFSGNTDDNFRIGLTITKKCLKLYADFYSSDIIIASPLGLRMLIGAENEKNRDFDFLSSIELLIMDQTHVFVMQNWEHVIHIINHMHLQPKDSHGSDLSRVRMWSLNGWSKYYMQSLIFSSHPVPEITALFTMFINYGGKVTVMNPIKTGSICQVAIHAPQVFHEVNTNSVLSAVDDRFEAFVSDILPQFKDPSMKHTLIFIPSYFDFVRLRNYFKKQEMKFVHICEYTQEKKITRARSKIFHGKTQFLLYTERFHFYRRIKLRGLRHIIFYQPPTNPGFYSEICNFLYDFKKGKDNQEDSDIDRSINVIYTKYDIIQIASVVGSERATKMLASEKSVHMFMSD